MSITNLVTPKAGAKGELLFNKPALGGFVEHQSLTKAAEQSVTKIVFLTIMIRETLKGGSKPNLLFNKPASESGLLNKSWHSFRCDQIHKNVGYSSAHTLLCCLSRT